MATSKLDGSLVEAPFYEPHEKFCSVYPALVVCVNAIGVAQLSDEQYEGLKQVQPLKWIRQTLGGRNIRLPPLTTLRQTSADISGPCSLILYLHTRLYDQHAPDEDVLQLVATSRLKLLPAESESSLQYCLQHEDLVFDSYGEEYLQCVSCRHAGSWHVCAGGGCVCC